MLTIAIIEDEQKERERLKQLLLRYSEEVDEYLTIKEFGSASKFLWEQK